MSKSIFKSLFGKKKNVDKVSSEPTVDISRVIPGYTPVDERIVSPASETSDVPPMDVQTEAPELDIEATSDERAPEERAEAAVDALSEKHDAWAQSDLAALNEAWAEARVHEDMTGQLNEVGRVAHNLKGIAATYGHPAMSRLASSLCTLLESDRAHNQHALINLHVEACRAAYLEGTRTDAGDEVAQSVCVALETQVKRTIGETA